MRSTRSTCELFPIFEEEALELLPKLAAQLRDWARRAGRAAHAAACMRTLHTLKGGARLAGAMRLGEMAHRLETRIERLTAGDAAVEPPTSRRCRAAATRWRMPSRRCAAATPRPTPSGRRGDAPLPVAAAPVEPPCRRRRPHRACAAPRSRSPARRAAPARRRRSAAPQPAAGVGKGRGKPRRGARGAAGRAAKPAALADAAAVAGEPLPSCPRSTGRASPPAAAPAPAKAAERAQALAQSAVRVRAPLLDRLVNQAGEVSITRSRIEVRRRPDQGLARRPDRQPGAPARPAARHRAAGRDADDARAWRPRRPRRRRSTRSSSTASRASRS